MFRLNNFKVRKDIIFLILGKLKISFILVTIAQMKKIIYIVTISTLILSCNSKDDYIADVYVNELIDLSLDPYNKLITPGSSIFANGGVKGIIIYHGVGNDYKVYDRNCSYEPSLSCSKIDSLDAGIAYCGCCPSFFLINDNGRSIYGPDLKDLKKYNWSLSNNNILRIFN